MVVMKKRIKVNVKEMIGKGTVKAAGMLNIEGIMLVLINAMAIVIQCNSNDSNSNVTAIVNVIYNNTEEMIQKGHDNMSHKCRKMYKRK